MSFLDFKAKNLMFNNYCFKHLGRFVSCKHLKNNKLKKTILLTYYNLWYGN